MTADHRAAASATRTLAAAAGVTAALVLAVLPAAPALAQDSRLPTAGEIAIAIAAGPEFNFGSNFHSGAVAGPVTIESRDWGDVYDYTLNVQGDIAYGLDTRSQIGLTLGWTTAEAETLDVGAAAGQVVSARFDDYQAYTARAYYRRYFQVGPGFFPYVTVNGGIRYVEKIDATFTSAALPALGLPTSVDSEFYDDSWVPTLGFAFGWRNEFRGVALGLETGLYYDFELKDTDTTLNALGLGSLNDSGDRLYIPVRLIIAY